MLESLQTQWKQTTIFSAKWKYFVQSYMKKILADFFVLREEDRRGISSCSQLLPWIGFCILLCWFVSKWHVLYCFCRNSDVTTISFFEINSISVIIRKKPGYMLIETFWSSLIILLYWWNLVENVIQIFIKIRSAGPKFVEDDFYHYHTT